ncbi:hypothetical protein [Deinococcus roseus]|uniref:Uncharacterized protein n=1 Tax=Deinococcus roseus TaxID=392414 RepID=A0ABQ2DF01_9DEIO|nr:hypothetical protein [Deinococcus roseus]GGJ55090.1 hypothetical protein GCM10008938_46480 [Deinococcus roseus]
MLRTVVLLVSLFCFQCAQAACDMPAARKWLGSIGLELGWRPEVGSYIADTSGFKVKELTQKIDAAAKKYGWVSVGKWKIEGALVVNAEKTFSYKGVKHRLGILDATKAGYTGPFLAIYDGKGDGC